MPEDRIFGLFSQFYKVEKLYKAERRGQKSCQFEKFFVLNIFAIWASFYLNKCLTIEFWDMDFFESQEGYVGICNKLQFLKYWYFGSQCRYKDK